jgi:hypothetical protein
LTTRGYDTIRIAAQADEGSGDIVGMSPDVPFPEPRPFRSEFARVLFEATKFSSTPEGCEEWSRLIPILMRDPDAREEEYGIVYTTMAMVCASSTSPEHELRLAHEVLHRYAGLRGSEDPDRPELDELRKFEVEHPDRKGERSALLLADVHPEGTQVYLDDAPICSEPCTLAVPIDGSSHLIEFVGSGQHAILRWKPSKPADAPPVIPQLADP